MSENIIKVDENDRIEFSLVLSGLNVAMDYVRNPLDPNMTREQVETYYDAVMTHFKSYKIKEHNLRVLFMNKYNVPYNFDFNDGILSDPIS